MDKVEAKGGEGLTVLSPVAGWFGPLEEAPDPVFAGGMMGPGGLIDPVAGELRAPCDGVILNLPGSLHALTLRADNGAEVLVHVGIETVGLQGKGFTAHVEEGSVVAAGDLLLSFDLDILADQATSLQTPVIVASEGYRVADLRQPGPVAIGEVLFRVVAVDAPDVVPSPDMVGGEGVTSEVRVLLGNGLHARPAARLADLAKQFDATGWLCLGGKRASARSPVAIMTLGVRHGDTLTVEASGEDAERLLTSLMQAITAGLGEEIVPVRSAAASKADASAQGVIKPIALDGSARLEGVTAAPGLVIGPVMRLDEAMGDFDEDGKGSQQEGTALSQALAVVKADIKRKLELAQGQAKSQQEEILRAHLVLLEDETLTGDAMQLIGQGKSAGFAWQRAIEQQISALKALDAPLLAERADDLADLERQVIARLNGEANEELSCEGAIIIARELYPSQFLRLAEVGAAGICLIGGGATSHVSILAAEKGMPALVAVSPGAMTIADGTPVILDADRGELHVAPAPEVVSETRKAVERRKQNYAAALAEAANPAHLQDGTAMEVFANLGGDQGAEQAVSNGAEGCGLLRTEFLYIGRATPPSREGQTAIYQAIADSLAGRPLVIRTLDIGGDKPAAFVHFDKEENPALGMRGIRLMQHRPDLFETQLRAILSVKTQSQISIMLPMVTSADEVIAVRAMLGRLGEEMGVSAGLPLGIMVETPASAVTAKTLAPHVDFFSIGTNDLSQYTLAMDRGNPQLAAKADSFHPAVLRLIAMTAEAGAGYGKWVGVCGSMASQPLAAPLLAGLGVTELSATASAVPMVKAVLRSVTMADCRKAAETAMEMESADAVRKHLMATWPHLQDWI
ncbi:phosphoenolpyruvate--protein phosphotransferase [Parvularcula flava]|uniref:phosphoenolpyruvate--protein phosphotransferase n=1 Tax=Aquisalinus luteolus TaxID=1566827 RepID=A0A8J3A163_9PROT|nr:phosphoenolpyruvate--protein phosphotransferase [Aquisalinus luteolus]NHK26456.1 phosphoenolpyruvate--protein phosphotransferase [Aquisalinus luteolus]GGH92388.1 phosphoenolpyruvate--protein phosphotransferase [Aquisalinus luteolus]